MKIQTTTTARCATCGTGQMTLAALEKHIAKRHPGARMEIEQPSQGYGEQLLPIRGSGGGQAWIWVRQSWRVAK